MTTPESERLSTAVSAPNRPVAVLDLGASAIRLLVAELPPGGTPRILEEASRAVLLGKDTFGGGRLGAPTIEATLRALEGFRRIMDSYGVVRYRAVATSAVREANNRDSFLDRVRLRAGIDVEVIDGSEENRLTYSRCARRCATTRPSPGRRRAPGRGGRRQRRPLVPAPGEPVYSGTYALGSVRMRQNLASWHGSHEQRTRLYSTGTVRNIVEDIRREMPLREARHFLALGGDVRFAADRWWATQDARGARRAARALPRLLRPRWRSTTTSWSRRTACRSPRPRRWCPRSWPTASCCSRRGRDRAGARGVAAGRAAARHAAPGEGQGIEDFTRQVLASPAALGERYRYDAPTPSTSLRSP